MKKLISILVAFAMMAALCVCMAFAADDPAPADPADAKLVKYLQIPEGTSVPDATFGFTFTEDAADSSNVTAQELTDSKPDNPTIRFNEGYATTVAEDGASVYKAIAVPALVNPAHAGVYAYTVTENDTYTITGKTDAQTIILNPDQDQYVVRYVVKNVGGTPTVTGITVQDKTGEKEDPTTEDPTTNDDTETTTVEYDGFTFKNVYQKTEGDGTLANAPLKVTKAVTGTDAPADAAFPFTMTLTKALGAADAAPSAQVYDKNGAPKGDAIPVTYGEAFTFDLMNGETLAFVYLPAGTRYEASELLATDARDYAAYAPSVAVNTDEYTASADYGLDLAAQAADATYLVSENDKDAVAYTNNYDKNIDTPTGILISNLPYIALALVAIGGLVAYVVVRRRQNDEA